LLEQEQKIGRASTNDREVERPGLPSIFSPTRDDERFVRTLYEELASRGLRVWWDRVSLPSRSLTFHQESRDAIEAHDRTIVVLGKRPSNRSMGVRSGNTCWPPTRW
jgi:hypothetical protein